jgi:hypothetical protein
MTPRRGAATAPEHRHQALGREAHDEDQGDP